MCIYRVLGLIIPMLCLSNYSACCASALSPQCEARTFSDNTFTNKAESFSVYEQVYLKIYCKGLSQGEHQINTEWIDNEGGLQRADSHVFHTNKQQDYSCFFQFKLMPKGSLLRMLSGNDFDDEQYGKWTVLIYVDNHQIGKNEFFLNDD
jgi:hypothetical protein